MKRTEGLLCPACFREQPTRIYDSKGLWGLSVLQLASCFGSPGQRRDSPDTWRTPSSSCDILGPPLCRQDRAWVFFQADSAHFNLIRTKQSPDCFLHVLYKYTGGGRPWQYLFFIRRTSRLRVTSSVAPWVGRAGDEAMTTPGAMVLAGAARIW